MTSYAALQASHVAEMVALVPEHLARLEWKRARIQAERETRLRELVALAKTASPWHRRRLAHLDAARVTEADLASVPPMTKGELMANWDAIVTDPRLTLDLVERTLAGITGDTYLLDEFHACVTGGSSGHRGVFVYDRRGWTLAYLGAIRHRLRHQALNPLPPGRAARIAFIGSTNPSHLSILFRTFAPAVQAELRSIDIGQPLAAVVSQLNEFQPTTLGAYSSMIALLAREALDGALRIAPHAISGGYDPVLPEVRELARRAWGREIYNLWGATECGFLACSSGSDTSLLLNDDLAIVEPVDAQGRAVPAGVASAKILVTNLMNRALPLIRYEIDDEITLLDEPDPQGSGHRQVAAILGRSDDAFRWAPAITVHPNLFRAPLSCEARVIEYQVLQRERGVALRLRATARFDTAGLASLFRRGLEDAGLAGARVDVEFVEDLGRTRLGKLRRFIPLQ